MLNLKETLGHRYRIFMDESYALDRAAINLDGAIAWYYELRGPKVSLYPKTADTFEVFLATHKGFKGLFKLAIGKTRLDDGYRLFFANKDALVVANKAKLYRKRQVTEAMRVRGKALAARYGFHA